MSKKRKKRLKKVKLQDYLDIKLEKDTWSLDVAFVRWINCRLKAYMRFANGFVDLTYNKFNFKGNEVTLRWCIKRMIELSDICLKDECSFYNKEYDEAENELYELWALTRRAVWW